MPFYGDLRDRDLFSVDEKDWVSRRLLDLRARLKSGPPDGVPDRTLRSSLIVGTWNIRDFDNNKYRHGPRRRESLFYIAETISAFDICALQEVNEDLGPLKKVMRILGPNWDFIATDVTVGPSGNRERMAFVFDKRKVRFRNIAGEIVLPKHKLLPDERQFARTPFMVSFQAGWFKFSLCTVHIFFGSHSKGSEGYERRVAEIEYIAKEMADRAERENENYILLGDFNIKNTVDETMGALTQAGWILPPELFPSNLLGTKYYDQIAFRTREDEVTFLSAGVFDFAKAVYRPEHYDHYAPVLPARHRDLKDDGTPKNAGKDKDYYAKRWLTWQMSDHLPLCVELAIDFSDEHLQHNLDAACAERGACAQPERRLLHPDEEDEAELVGALKDKADADAAARQASKRAKTRKAPEIPVRDKVGVARPDRPFTLGEAWRVFWYVASGKADRVKKRRKARAQSTEGERAKARRK
ncbi:MAG: endonuclease/exonuclease/phosphatase family protein [Pseudomonadota bacterium]